eukprot:m.307055 g.307055  ORF g.307055 m.307055 type:complete len:98 (+) comp41855_c1_seq1:787-1080(+)
MESPVVFEKSRRRERRGACVDVGCRIDPMDVIAGELVGLNFVVDPAFKNPALSTDGCLYPGFCHIHSSSKKSAVQVQQQARVVLSNQTSAVGTESVQ